MAHSTAQTPFQWLQEVERRARQKARGLPRPKPVQQIWRGIGFRLDQTLLVVPLKEIREIITCPSKLAKVPGAKSWVKGIANVRGTLLTVIDLKECLEAGRSTKMENRTRLVVINQAGIVAGLMVDEVLGIKHFPEQLREETPCSEIWLNPFTNGLFPEEDKIWIVFDMQVLAKSEVFLKAAL